MANDDLLLEYKKDVEQLSYKDRDHLDKIIRKGNMLIRNIYGDDSHYLNDLAKIGFRPCFSPSSEEYQRECWDEGKQAVINLTNTLLEELKLFGAGTTKVGKKETIKEKVSNRVFIVHGHDDTAKTNLARFLVLPQNLWVDFRTWRPEQLPG